MNTTENTMVVELESGLIFILALACGSIVANLYYAQTLILAIGKSLNLNLQLSGLIVTVTQIGYGIGLLFIVPLADIIENKRLIIGLLILICICLLSIIFVNTGIVFLLSCLLLGVTAVAAQIIIPLVAHFTPLESRGKSVGIVMSGLLFGIMLARPLASLFADLLSWRAIFIFSICLILGVTTILCIVLPSRIPEHKMRYKELVASLPKILQAHPILQRRAIYHSALFGIFSLFWTSIAIELIKNYHYSQIQVAIFAFVGAAGALAAPIAGNIADKGFTRFATGVAIAMVGLSCLLAKAHFGNSIGILVIAALILDVGVSCNLILGQRAIFALAPQVRSRLNGLYMAIFFMGGAIGSGLSGYLYAKGGWSYITNMGFYTSLIVFIYFLTEYFKKGADVK